MKRIGKSVAFELSLVTFAALLGALVAASCRPYFPPQYPPEHSVDSASATPVKR